ncbi:hypothetical protein ACIA8J_36855 [Streptomyces asoensis]|uniref:hypothetical protein n=1 Tax=Streptomyces asoensis TaxID=249586 RepID=UPI0037936279
MNAVDSDAYPDYNPVDRGMWDFRRIRGGSSGHGFAVAPGYEDDPRLIHGEPALDGTPRPGAPGVCAGGPRALLDFSWPHLAAERAVAASWDLWHSLSAMHPAAGPLADLGSEAYLADLPGDTIIVRVHCHC